MAMTEMQSPVIINYARDEYLAEVKTLQSGDTSVTFTTAPNGDFGVWPWFDKSTASTPGTTPPVVKGDNITFGTPSGGLVSVTVPFVSAVTSAQAGTKMYLRIYK